MNKLVICGALFAMSFAVQGQDLWSVATETKTSLKFDKNLVDTPIPVSVLTSADFVTYNIQTLQDALSLLPGVVVSRDEYFHISIGYHEMSSVHPRRMLVLIDDIPIMTSGLQRVSWWNLPISIDDIERIEMTRSPNAVLDGSNSFNGTIHIKTKRKAEQAASSLSFFQDDFGNKASARFQQKIGENRFSLSISKSSSDGYENVRDDSENLSLSASYDYSSGPLDFSLTLMSSDGERDGRVAALLSNLPISYEESQYASANFDYNFESGGVLSGSIQKSKWRSDERYELNGPLVAASPALGQLYQIDPDVANAIFYSGFIPAPDYENFGLFLQIAGFAQATGLYRGETYDFSNDVFLYEDRMAYKVNYKYQDDNYEFSFGVNIIDEDTSTEVYFPTIGQKSQTIKQYVGSGSYEFNWGVLSGSAMIEDSDLFGSNTQARLSALRKLSSNSSVRASFSRTHRLPSIWENFGGFGYSLDIAENPYGLESGDWFVQNVSAGDLEPELNVYKEFGYHYVDLSEAIEFDVSLFHSDYDGLILEPLRLVSFNPTNSRDIELYGIEASFSKGIGNHNIRVFAAIADSNLTSGDEFIDDEMQFSLENGAFSPTFNTSLIYSYQFGENWNVTSELEVLKDSYDQNRERVKFGLSKGIEITSGINMKLSGFVEHSPNEILNNRILVGESKLGDDTRFSASARIFF